MKYKVLTRRVSLLIYRDNEPTNYSAACQININGTHGTIDTLIGKDFYEFLYEHGWKPFGDLGLTEVSAGVTEAHLRLLKMYLRNIDISIVRTGEPEELSKDIKLIWISLKEKPA